MVALSFLAVRLDIVVPAYVAPQLSGFSLPNLGLNYSYSYFPNLYEWQFLAFVSCSRDRDTSPRLQSLASRHKNKSEKVPVVPQA